MGWAAAQGLVTQEVAEYLQQTQFRSYEFLPRVARWVMEDHDVPSTPYADLNFPDTTFGIWWKDCFGNLKTSFLAHELDEARQWLGQELPFYDRLKDVPNGELAFIVGSSGLEDKRFLEIVLQGGSAGDVVTRR